jgi:hypothetical protein
MTRGNTNFTNNPCIFFSRKCDPFLFSPSAGTHSCTARGSHPTRRLRTGTRAGSTPPRRCSLSPYVRGDIYGRWCLTSDRTSASMADDPRLAGSGGCPQRAVAVVPCEGGDIHSFARCQKTSGELVDASACPPSYGRRGPMAKLQRGRPTLIDDASRNAGKKEGNREQGTEELEGHMEHGGSRRSTRNNSTWRPHHASPLP